MSISNLLVDAIVTESVARFKVPSPAGYVALDRKAGQRCRTRGALGHSTGSDTRALGQLHDRLRTQRAFVPDGSGIAAEIDNSLNAGHRSDAFEDRNVSCHNNHLDNLMRPWAIVRKAWLFAGSELVVKRTATATNLVQSARMY